MPFARSSAGLNWVGLTAPACLSGRLTELQACNMPLAFPTARCACPSPAHLSAPVYVVYTRAHAHTQSQREREREHQDTVEEGPSVCAATTTTTLSVCAKDTTYRGVASLRLPCLAFWRAEHHYLVRVLDRIQPMCDHECRAPMLDVIQSSLHNFFALRVKGCPGREGGGGISGTHMNKPLEREHCQKR